MRIVLLVLFSLIMVGCASTATPIDIPVEIVTGGDVGEVNTSITNSVQNIVSHLEWWHMATIVGLAWLVGWLSPGPMEIIRGFFKGMGAVITGFRGLW
ncbi:TMhelix containing protein [Vibrio phage 464E53-1]|nr:TMhelix containing protein [Vibrio phage 464E53-1]